MRYTGVTSRGIIMPIFRQGDDLVSLIRDNLIAAAENEGFQLQDRDVIGVTEAVVSGVSVGSGVGVSDGAGVGVGVAVGALVGTGVGVGFLTGSVSCFLSLSLSHPVLSQTFFMRASFSLILWSANSERSSSLISVK